MKYNRRAKFAAKRGLRFIPLNEASKGLNAHHINNMHVIFLPYKLHHKKPHNVKTGEGMEYINKKAFKYLFTHKEHMIKPFGECKNIMNKVVNNSCGIL